MTALVPSSLVGDSSFEVSEAISARDLNNLYLTSCYFRDRERFQAFCGLYALMRVIDDRVDAITDRTALSDQERDREHGVIDAWASAFIAAVEGVEISRQDLFACETADAPALLEAAARSMRLFPVPLVLWQRFFRAMHADVDQARFATYAEFLDYTEGASVAPTTIYLYLLAAERQGEGPYLVPSGFDLLTCGRHLGTFAYLAHILRDLAEDLEATDQGLVYLSTEDLAAYGLDEEALRQDLQKREARPKLRELVAELAGRSREHLAAGRALLAPLAGRLEKDCDFILELIVTLYDQILRRIEAADDDPMRGEHQLTLEQKQEIAMAVAARVGFEI